MITVYFDQGKSFLLTSLIEVSADNSELIFDLGSDSEMNRKALLADKLIFITAIDRVKVQFSLKRLSQKNNDGRPAFSGALPETLLRLQRREYFRLSTPIASPIKCTVPMTRPDGSALVIDSPLLDISGGGIGLMAQPDQSELYKSEMEFKNCKIDLPDEGLLVLTLRVRNAFDVVTKSGSRYIRVGCEFVDLTGPRLTMIQRYITRIERERKARLSGLG
jgi:c-di-GMP-binding flagellar brake protein YcgR